MDFLEMFIAAVAAFMLGFGWYTALFGKAWQAESGITDEQAQQGMAKTHGLAFLMMLILAMGLSYIIHMHSLEEQNFVHGAMHGAMAAGIFAIPAMSIQYLYQRKSFKLWAIDASYVLMFMALEGGVLAALKLFTEMPK